MALNDKKTDGKVTGFDRALIDFVNDNLEKIALGALILLAIVIRVILIPNTELSPDYLTYYKPWVEAYREYGFFAGLGKEIGDYYVPYNVMYAICSIFPCEPYIPIAIFSIAAELVTAYFLYKIADSLTDGQKTTASAFAAAITLFLPFVIWNGALWKQCDAVYVMFIVIALYMLVSDKYRAAFIFLAVAFGFKLQAVFFIPLFMVLYFARKKFSILEFFWIPAMYVILGLPSVLCKKGIRATYLAYLSQTNEVQTEGYGLVSYYPNFYNFGLDNHAETLKLAGVIMAVVVLGITAVYLLRHRSFLSDSVNMMYAGIFMAWTCCMFLPGMHERYDYAVVLLMTLLCLTAMRDRLPVALAMNVCSFLVYVTVLFREDVLPITVISAIEVAAYLFAALDIMKKAGTHNA